MITVMIMYKVTILTLTITHIVFLPYAFGLFVTYIDVDNDCIKDTIIEEALADI